MLVDGRSIGGFVADRDPQIVVMRELDGDILILNAEVKMRPTYPAWSS